MGKGKSILVTKNKNKKNDENFEFVNLFCQNTTMIYLTTLSVGQSV
jgi:hypothetical protein